MASMLTASQGEQWKRIHLSMQETKETWVQSLGGGKYPGEENEVPQKRN